MYATETLLSNKDIKKCKIGDIIILEYLNGLKYLFIIKNIDNDVLIVNNNNSHNDIQESYINLEYHDYIKNITRIYEYIDSEDNK